MFGINNPPTLLVGCAHVAHFYNQGVLFFLSWMYATKKVMAVWTTKSKAQ